MKVNTKEVWKVLFTGAGSYCAKRGILTNLDSGFFFFFKYFKRNLSGIIYIFSDYSGKYIVSHNKDFYKNTTFPKI